MKETLYFGPFRLDVAGQQLWHGDQPVPLAPKALDVLVYLADHAGEVVPRERLFDAIWPGTFVDDHALSVQVREIRKALGDDVHQPRFIETRHRRGYCFKAAVTRTARPAAAAGSGAAERPGRPHVYPVPVVSTGGSAAAVALSLPETHYARSGDVNIAYQVIGDGPIDLVFVMGWVSHLEYFWTEPGFARFLNRLASFSRLILFDKRGTGLSDRVPVDELPTIEQRMHDLRAVMEAAGSEHAIICGVSEGGCMSAVFAATHPEKTAALVMIGSYARRLRAADYPWAPTLEERERFLEEIREHWGGPVGLEDRAPSLAADPHFREWWATYLRMGASPGAAIALTRMNTEVDIRDVLPLVGVPTLVVHRTGDRCLKVEEGRYLASRIPGARFVELPGEDHLPFVGDQDAILREVERFATQVQHTLGPDRVLATILCAGFVSPDGVPADAARWETAVRSQLKRFRATGVHVLPDGLVAAFDGPARAVRCAFGIQDQASRLGLHMNAGLHTGECVCGEREIAGTAVEIAGRIRQHAAPGKVLVSGTLRDLVPGSGIVFHPSGRLEAEGLGEWQLLEVRHA